MAMTAFELVGLLTLNTTEFDKGLSSAKTSANNFGSKLVSGLGKVAAVGTAVLGAATAGATAFAKSAVSAGSVFDTAMGGVAATMGETMEEMEQNVGEVDTAYGHFAGTLRDFAIFMGQNTTFSATQAARALNYMALAGYDAQESMSMLPSVLSMAAAGSMDLALASDMITDTQSALGLSFERTSQMVDEFAKAAATGNTSVQQLGEAFLRVGGLAKNLNEGIVTLSDGTLAEVDGVQELEIAFTAMANAGVKGVEAGTHMRNMLLKLSSPTKDGAKSLAAMGVSVFDATGKMKPLSEIFSGLSDAMGKMTQAEKLNVISELFNARDMASAEALLAAINNDWDAIGESILQADGSASQMSKTKLNNLAGDITLFRSALEAAYITLNDKLSPALRDFVQFGTKSVQDLTVAYQEGGLDGLMEGLGDSLSEGISIIFTKMPDFIDAGGKLLGALGQGMVDNSDILIKSGFKIVKTLRKSFLKAIPGMIDVRLTLVESVFDAIGNADGEFGSEIQDFLKKIGEVLTKHGPMLWSSVKGLVGRLITKAANALPGLMKSVTDSLKTWAKDQPWVQSIVDAIEKIPEKFEEFKGKVKEVFDKIKGYADEVDIEGFKNKWDEAIAKVKEVWDSLSEKAGEVWDKIKGYVEGIDIEALKQAWEDATAKINDSWTHLQEVLQPVFDWLAETWDKLKAKFSEWLSQFDEYVTSGDAAKDTTDTLKSAIDFLGDAISGVIDFLANIITKLTEFVDWLNSGSMEADALKGAIMGIIAAFGLYEAGMLAVKVATAAWTAAQWLLNAALSANPIAIVIAAIAALVGAIIYLWNNNEEFRTAILAMWANIQETTANVVAAFKKFFTEDIPSFFNKMWEKAKEIGNNLKEFFTETIPGYIQTAVDFLAGLPGKALSWGKDLIDNFVSGIKGKISAVTDAVKEVAGKVADFLGFSEPDKGPLSNFHTFAPDMMELFMKGVRDNENELQATVGHAFDFENLINSPTTSSENGDVASKRAARGGNNYTINVNQPVSTPADMLREIRTEAQYGLMIGEELA